MSRCVITWTCKWLNCRCHDRFAEMKALVSRRMLYPFPFSVWTLTLLPVAPLFSSWNYSSWRSVNKGSFRLSSLSFGELAIKFAVNDAKHPFYTSKKVWNLKCITFRAHNFFAKRNTDQSNRLTIGKAKRANRLSSLYARVVIKAGSKIFSINAMNFANTEHSPCTQKTSKNSPDSEIRHNGNVTNIWPRHLKPWLFLANKSWRDCIVK